MPEKYPANSPDANFTLRRSASIVESRRGVPKGIRTVATRQTCGNRL